MDTAQHARIVNFKQFGDNDGFRKWLAETIFTETYEPGKAGEQGELVAD
jgi:hypothetical protein